MSFVRILHEDGTSEDIDASVERLDIFHSSVTDIDLSGLLNNETLSYFSIDQTNIDKLDLSPLSSCTNLKSLKMHFNHKLQSLDLTPLSSCTNLTDLTIRGTSLKQLNLGPLSSCLNLKHLSVIENPKLLSLDLAGCPNLDLLSILQHESLKTLDLIPLSSCINLGALQISDTPLQKLDLSPLSNCFNLQLLEINLCWDLEWLDLRPLLFCNNLKTLELSVKSFTSDSILSLHPLILEKMQTDPWAHEFESSHFVESIVNTYGWSHLKNLYSLCEDESQQIMWGWRFVQALGLAELMGYDGVIDSLLEELIEHDYISGRDFVSKRMISFLSEQLLRRGTTVFMNPESMTDKQAAVLITEILDLRQHEMQDVQVKETYDGIDLLPLALTAYGFKIVEAMNIDRFDWEFDPEPINKKLHEAGLPPLNVVHGEFAIPPTHSEAIVQIVCKRLGWPFNDNH